MLYLPSYKYRIDGAVAQLGECLSRPLQLIKNLWGHSSAGRVLAWHARGRGFDPLWLHSASRNCFCVSLRRNSRKAECFCEVQREGYWTKQNTLCVFSLTKYPRIRRYFLKLFMKAAKIVIRIIAATEILIGAVTLGANTGFVFSGFNPKPINVLVFVIWSSILSICLGLGLIGYKKIAHDLLIYFSSVVIVSKLLIFMGIIGLNGALETSIPPSIKNYISMIYHAAVILYLNQSRIKKLFVK